MKSSFTIKHLNNHIVTTPPHMQRVASIAKFFPLCVLSLFLLTACGGGGGGVTPTTPTIPTTPPVFVPRSAPTASVLNHPDPADYVSKKHRSEANDEYTVGWSLNSDSSVKGTTHTLLG